MKPFALHLAVSVVLFNCFGISLAAEKVCYGKYGCFSNDPPFNRNWPNTKLPKSPEEMGTTYYLYTRENRTGINTIDDSDVDKLKTSSYDGSKKTVLIIHGWNGNPLNSEWVKEMKQEFLKREDMNVIAVGWAKGAASAFFGYYQPVANSRLVGAMIAEFIKFLNEQTGNTPESFHIVGFSLGAHVSGYAGKRFQEITKKRIARITGLDPAYPGYGGYHTDVRIDASDGAFVDVIHTDADSIVGIADESGHFDFWPNGGGSQPGCDKKRKRSEILMKKIKRQRGKKRNIANMFFNFYGCEHNQAHKYFIESLKATKKSFVSYRCGSMDDFNRAKCTSCAEGCPEMGINAVQYKDSPRGNFYLITNDKSPYSIAGYMELTFKTGNSMKYAPGHNPRVILYGTGGDTGEIKLDRHLDQGSTEKFVVPIKTEIGDLTHISVQNDPEIIWCFWELNQVSVKNLDSGKTYTVCYKKPLNGSFVKKPLTIGEATCKQRKHLIRDRSKKCKTRAKTHVSSDAKMS